MCHGSQTRNIARLIWVQQAVYWVSQSLWGIKVALRGIRFEGLPPGHLRVLEVASGTWADMAGIRVGDYLCEVVTWRGRF
eukprot:5748586-Amphidinium_carterae.2